MMGDRVGYIDLRRFSDPELTDATLAAAMRGAESHPRAHLRPAAQPDRPVPWVDFRSRDGVEHLQTLSAVQGPRYLERPVYILTSRRIFSTGEGFAYHMQALKRAAIVGERTAGGGNPGYRKRIGRHFWMFVSTARAVSPVTGTNWEGRRPARRSMPTRAMDVALGLAQDR